MLPICHRILTNAREQEPVARPEGLIQSSGAAAAQTGVQTLEPESEGGDEKRQAEVAQVGPPAHRDRMHPWFTIFMIAQRISSLMHVAFGWGGSHPDTISLRASGPPT